MFESDGRMLPSHPIRAPARPTGTGLPSLQNQVDFINPPICFVQGLVRIAPRPPAPPPSPPPKKCSHSNERRRCMLGKAGGVGGCVFTGLARLLCPSPPSSETHGHWVSITLSLKLTLERAGPVRALHRRPPHPSPAPGFPVPGSHRVAKPLAWDAGRGLPRPNNQLLLSSRASVGHNLGSAD